MLACIEARGGHAVAMLCVIGCCHPSCQANYSCSAACSRPLPSPLLSPLLSPPPPQLVYNVYPPAPWASGLLLFAHFVCMIGMLAYRGLPRSPKEEEEDEAEAKEA